MRKQGVPGAVIEPRVGRKWRLGTYRALVGVMGVLVVDLLAGCGVAGSPIPPEDVGIAAKVEQEKREAQRAEVQERDRERAEPQERRTEEEAAQDDILLPPLRPIGTQ